MCMITPQKAARKAKTEIECYKLVLKDMNSPNFSFLYTPFKTFKTTLGVYNTNAGYRFSTPTVVDYITNNPKYIRNKVIIKEGFHSFLDIPKATKDYVDENHSMPDKILFKAIIPIHSNYYIDEFGMIVSDAIILTNEVSLKEAFNNPKTV